MKFKLLLSVLLWPLFAVSQINETFDDGEFLTDPVWSGNTENFQVNLDGQLQLQDDEEAFSYLSTPLEDENLDNKEWNFYIELGLSGSSNNNSRVYLSSQSDDLTYSGTTGAGAMGYFLQFGESGSGDAIRLYRDDVMGGSVEELGAGLEGFISSSFAITIRVLRDDLGNWEVYADPSAGENYQLQFLASDDTYDTGIYFGMTAKYTVSNSENFYYDNIYYGDEIVDTEIPIATSVQLLSENSLAVLFNEALSQASAEEISNYELVGIGNPIDAELDLTDFNTVVLTFLDPFVEDVEQEIIISGIEDLSGNPMESTSFNFTWSVPDIPLYRDVVINEILADPSPVVGLPEIEYVELYNASESTFNIEDWVFVNSESEMNLPNLLLAPGDFILLCDQGDVTQLLDFGTVIGIPSFPALANLEDHLELKDNLGNLLDEVDYNIGWYDVEGTSDGGYSLEQKNPLGSCAGGDENWGSSISDLGGTPGSENSIFSDELDITPPQVVSILPLNNGDLIEIAFDGPLDVSSISLANFSISPIVPIESVFIGDEDHIVRIEFVIPIIYETEYTLIITSLTDCQGNDLVENIEFPFVLAFEPFGDRLIINEIMADPDVDLASPNAEFIEIYNRSEVLVELFGVSVSGATIEDVFQLEPNGHVVITDVTDLDEFSGDIPVLGVVGFPSLTNSGRELQLLSSEGFVLDSLEYDLSWYNDNSKDDGGYSLELINPNDPCSDSSNWRASQSISGATEGEQNSVFDDNPDTEAPTAVKILVWTSDQIEVFFDEPIDIDSAISAEYTVTSDSGESINVVGVDAGGPHSILLLFDQDIPEAILWSLNMSGVQDCWGNELNTADGLLFAAIEEAQGGDLIINEILFNPKTNGVDYVEVYNRSPRNLTLNGWFLANEEDGEIDNSKLIADEPILLLAGEYVVLSTESMGVSSIYPFTVVSALLEMESFPSYPNDEGSVILLNPEGELEDRVDYNDDMQFALLDDLDGVSLERIRVDVESSEANNWHSAAESQGYGTPGYMNSASIAGALGDGEFYVEPKVFSPDQDGYQDLTSIFYNFSEEGFVGNVMIYDRAGREVRHLMKNELLGTSGVVNWDGVSEDGESLPIGIYTIVFEYFDLDSRVYKEKLTCVLAKQLN